MSDALATYLHDHLTGSHFAVKLLESLSEQYPGEGVSKFAVELNTEIKEDQQTLQTIVDRVGPSKLDITEAVGWVAEKASRLKLGRDLDGVGLEHLKRSKRLPLGFGESWRCDAHYPEFVSLIVECPHLTTPALRNELRTNTRELSNSA
jgi:hypothetical protein